MRLLNFRTSGSRLNTTPLILPFGFLSTLRSSSPFFSILLSVCFIALSLTPLTSERCLYGFTDRQYM